MQAMIGKFKYALDDKNRVRFPSKFLEGLGNDIIMVPGLEGRINVMSLETFAQQHPGLFKPNLFNLDFQNATTDLFEAACDASPDAQGRITVGPEIRNLLGDDKEVVLIGKLVYVEMWPAKAYAERSELMSPQAVSKALEQLGAMLAE